VGPRVGMDECGKSGTHLDSIPGPIIITIIILIINAITLHVA